MALSNSQWSSVPHSYFPCFHGNSSGNNFNGCKFMADPSQILVTLERGIRAHQHQLGSTAEVVFFYSKLIEVNQSSATINTVFLKLADQFFHSQNNMIRYLIYSICHKNKEILYKIRDASQVIIPIYRVLISEDSDVIAKCLGLRILGCMAPVLVENCSAQQSILESLNSTETQLVESALVAVRELGRLSPSFAATSLPCLMTLLKSQVGIPTKTLIMETLKSMTVDSNIAFQAYFACKPLVDNFLPSVLMGKTVETLTALAIATPTELSTQLELLCQLVQSDPRVIVLSAVLQSMRWTTRIIKPQESEKLLEIATTILSTGYHPILKTDSLQLVLSLLDSSCVKVGTKERIDACKQVYKNSPQAMKVYIQLLVLESSKTEKDYVYKEMTSVIHDLVKNVGFIEEFTLSWRIRLLKLAFHALYPCSPVHSEQLALELLFNTENSNFHHALAVTLSHFHSTTSRIHLLSMLDRLTEWILTQQPLHGKTFTALCIYLFRSIQGTFLDQKHLMLQFFNPLNERVTMGLKNWWQFVIAREAMLTGYYVVATPLLEKLANQVESETFHLWLSSCKELCQSQMENNSFMQALDSTQKALLLLKSASTLKYPLTFPMKFLKLRSLVLEQLIYLEQLCGEMIISHTPSPTYDPNLFTRIGHAFETLGHQYQDLYSQSFGARRSCLDVLSALAQKCFLLSSMVNFFLNTTLTGNPRNPIYNTISGNNRNPIYNTISRNPRNPIYNTISGNDRNTLQPEVEVAYTASASASAYTASTASTATALPKRMIALEKLCWQLNETLQKHYNNNSPLDPPLSSSKTVEVVSSPSVVHQMASDLKEILNSLSQVPLPLPRLYFLHDDDKRDIEMTLKSSVLSSDSFSDEATEIALRLGTSFSGRIEGKIIHVKKETLANIQSMQLHLVIQDEQQKTTLFSMPIEIHETSTTWTTTTTSTPICSSSSSSSMTHQDMNVQFLKGIFSVVFFLPASCFTTKGKFYLTCKAEIKDCNGEFWRKFSPLERILLIK